MINTHLLQATFDKITHYLSAQQDGSQEVVNYQTPASLSSIVDFSIPKEGVDHEAFNGLVDQYLTYAVKTGNPQFFNQLYAGFNLPGFLGEVLTAATNTSMYTYEVAPVATMIEKEMIALMNRYTGYTDGDGIFLSGGSNANLVAMFSARNRLVPDSRFHGIKGDIKLSAFVNEQAHYSFETAANLMGLGSKSVIKVKADADGRMIPEELFKEMSDSISRGETPFFVAVTCATTLLGAYDPIEEIVDIAKEFKAWVHADGSFGGSLLLSQKHRHLMRSIEKTDSIAWNPHKLMNIPLVCSVLLVKDHETLYRNLTDLNTDYIFHENDMAEDLGKKAIQCGRRVDAVKLWLAWKYYGLDGYEKRIDHLIEMAEYAEEKVKKHPSLELMTDRQSFTVCFRYKGDYQGDVNKLNLTIREQLRISGRSLVNYGYLNGNLVIRWVVANAGIQKSDIDLFFVNFNQTTEEVLSLQ